MDKEAENIKYNYLNLPRIITAAQGNTSYIYRADGTKVNKNFGANKIIDYLDGFQYQNSVLQFVPTLEGYYDFIKKSYIYNYLDHLGNVRVSYFRNNGNSTEVLEENNYYPFGLKHEGYNFNLSNPAYSYKYQGQELQETGFYSFKWRNYMPDVGRFFNIDMLAEDYSYQSPYNFAENQVIAFVELEGLEKGLPWYLNENKYGGKPVLTLGAHNVKLPYAQRSEYKGNATEKAGIFVVNTLGSIYNGVASSWNDAMEGKTAGQMVQEGDRDMETSIRDAERNGVKMEHIESLTAVALIHKAGGKMSNKLTPNKEAAGDHSSFSRDKNGNIYKYETYEKTKTGHFNPTKRFDGGKPDGSSGSPHIDKKSGQSVTTPHVQDKSGNTRKPTNDELPRNKRFN